ncbi:hypothetical protein [Burkholderia seminalis]|uniref:Uncharacterized protein n=1 Tax=Burkholderia seminalis TaxID=488731 RepID=A0A8A8DET0_9BURK|nr:hypothetical protein [Burkholderia seminalis]QTO22980.1 hypothetical protein DT99_033295 [Burkholderia seminalis]
MAWRPETARGAAGSAWNDRDTGIRPTVSPGCNTVRPHGFFMAGVSPAAHAIERAAAPGALIRNARPVQMMKWCQNVTTARASRAAGPETADD